MKKILAVLPFICLVSVSSSAGELEVSTGFGHQYGGVLGVQFSNKTELSKYYISTGLLGAAVGFETTFQKNSKHSYGLSVGAEAASSEDGFAFATYNYHFKGFSNKGLVIGTGIGIRRHEETLGANDTETLYSLTLNIGYKF
jgi:hypothetical protein